MKNRKIHIRSFVFREATLLTEKLRRLLPQKNAPGKL